MQPPIHREKYLGYDLRVYQGIPGDKNFKVVVHQAGRIARTGSIRRKRKHSLFGAKHQDRARKIVSTGIFEEKRKLKEAIDKIHWERNPKLEVTQFILNFKVVITQDTITKETEHSLSENGHYIWEDLRDHRPMRECLDTLERNVNEMTRNRRAVIWREVRQIEKERL